MPEKIGPYTVVSKIGGGGMGVVYKGRDESLHRFVAIKVLTENLSDDATFLQRFEREAQAAASLSHPNIVQIYSIGHDEAGHPYFVMEYVSGQSLEQLLRSEGRIDDPRASQLVLQAAQGLAAAHDHGIVHRDIKPANLILDDRGLLKIADFGLALPPGSETQLTATGMMVGTAGYLSPEQFDGAKADALTDIYALGVTYYMLLTGTPPFRGESPLALMKQIVDANPADVTTVNPNVDPESRRILARMIAKDRAQRYPNCHELVADLENLIASMGVRSATAGLARPAATPATLEAMSAPTVVISREATQPMMPQAAAAIATAGTPLTTAPIVSPTAPSQITSPGTPLLSPPTDPAIAVPGAQQYVPPPPPPKKRSSAAVLLVVLFAFVLVAGGAAAAIYYGTGFVRAWRSASAKTDTSQPVAAALVSKSPSATPSNPPPDPAQGVLLSQPTTPSPLSTDSSGHDASAPLATPDGQTMPASATTPSEPVHQSAAKSSAPATMATPREPAHRALSGVAVAAVGDRALVGAVSSVLRSEARESGLKAVDAHQLPSTEELLDGRPTVRELIARVRDDGYAVLMLAKIEPTGERQLSYYGRQDTAYSARVTVTAYDTASGRPIGSSESGTIEYTSINIETESQDVVGPLARSCARMIRSR